MTDAAANQIASAELLFCISAGRTAAFTSSDENWARNLAPAWKYQACSISVVVEDESAPGALSSPLGREVSCGTLWSAALGSFRSPRHVPAGRGVWAGVLGDPRQWLATPTTALRASRCNDPFSKENRSRPQWCFRFSSKAEYTCLRAPIGLLRCGSHLYGGQSEHSIFVAVMMVQT